MVLKLADAKTIVDGVIREAQEVEGRDQRRGMQSRIALNRMKVYPLLMPATRR
jgi:hypothetical protein